mmetsp:Transcript_24833/g.58941  ORF Transcript_24833/g.58941 Transcript_24833/m.58941 type:complete len:169 (+) Transcript_24833:606-1112(+)
MNGFTVASLPKSQLYCQSSQGLLLSTSLWEFDIGGSLTPSTNFNINRSQKSSIGTNVISDSTSPGLLGAVLASQATHFEAFTIFNDDRHIDRSHHSRRRDNTSQFSLLELKSDENSTHSSLYLHQISFQTIHSKVVYDNSLVAVSTSEEGGVIHSTYFFIDDTCATRG